MNATAPALRTWLFLKVVLFSIFLGGCAKLKRVGNGATGKRRYAHLWKVGMLDKGWSYQPHIPRQRKRSLKPMEVIEPAPVAVALNHPLIMMPDRNLKVRQDTLFFDHKELRIEVWDGLTVDGDTVSLYLAEQKIVDQRMIKRRAFGVNVTLDSDAELLTLFAHNTGEEGGNTASIAVSDGVNTYQILLNSNLETCEAITLALRPS